MPVKKICILFLFFHLDVICFSQTKSFLITSFGAVNDGITNNAVAIQTAIDEANIEGGGIVIIPAGKFITGTIELKSNVELHFNDGAVLQGSDKRLDYNSAKPALIIAVKQHNISITGKGIIDGKGRELMKNIFTLLKAGTLKDAEWKIKRPSEKIRTNLLYLEECSDVKITGISFKDATSWVTHYERCKNVTIDSIKLESMAYWNNDGLDIVDCKNVHITNSFINTADDAICLKSTKANDFCDSIYVSDCTLRSSASAFKLGTGSKGGFKNITVRNLTIYDTYRSAIALEAVDGGFLENIDIRNITAKNTGNAIFIRAGHRNLTGANSTIKNIFIKDVKVQIPKGKPDAGYEMEAPVLKYPRGIKPDKNKVVSLSPWNNSSIDSAAIIYKHNVFPSSITGLPGHAVENVRLENIEIVYETVADKTVNYFPLDSFHIITEAEKEYPEFSMFGELPVWGFYVRHVKGLSMNNISVKMKGKDFRTAFLFDDVKELEVNFIDVPFNTMPVMVLHKIDNSTIQNLKLSGDKNKSVMTVK